MGFYLFYFITTEILFSYNIVQNHVNIFIIYIKKLAIFQVKQISCVYRKFGLVCATIETATRMTFKINNFFFNKEII